MRPKQASCRASGITCCDHSKRAGWPRASARGIASRPERGLPGPVPADRPDGAAGGPAPGRSRTSPGLEVPEPGLAGLEAPDDRVPGRGRVRAGVLRRRAVAAADVPALRAAPQVNPPAPAASHSAHPVPLGGTDGSTPGSVVTRPPLPVLPARSAGAAPGSGCHRGPTPPANPHDACRPRSATRCRARVRCPRLPAWS